jgi:uncharacterized protein (DUF1778 family)
METYYEVKILNNQIDFAIDTITRNGLDILSDEDILLVHEDDFDEVLIILNNNQIKYKELP